MKNLATTRLHLQVEGQIGDQLSGLNHETEIVGDVVRVKESEGGRQRDKDERDESIDDG